MDDREKQAYNALNKWAFRLNLWEYDKQVKRNHGKKLEVFSPHYFSLMLIDAMKELRSGNVTADKAMALLHTVDGRTMMRLCMEAGF